jgi:multidrug efflux pump subunit AcrA (membrane-fusion protein)
MSASDQVHPTILSLLAALTGADVKTVRFLNITPKEGQSIEDAVAEAEAEHRKTCEGCAAAYAEAEQEALDRASKAKSSGIVEAMEARKQAEGATAGERIPAAGAAAVVVGRVSLLLGATESTADKFIIQVPPGSSVTVGTDLFDTQAAAEEPKRTPIGWMAFAMKGDKMTPILQSFSTDRSVVEKQLAQFDALPEMVMMQRLAKFIGHSSIGAEIRPVFGE